MKYSKLMQFFYKIQTLIEQNLPRPNLKLLKSIYCGIPFQVCLLKF